VRATVVKEKHWEKGSKAPPPVAKGLTVTGQENTPPPALRAAAVGPSPTFSVQAIEGLAVRSVEAGKVRRVKRVGRAVTTTAQEALLLKSAVGGTTLGSMRVVEGMDRESGRSTVLLLLSLPCCPKGAPLGV